MAIFEKSMACGHCHLHDACPMTDEDEGDSCDSHPDSQGLGLLMSASTVFLLPLATGIGGAFVVGQWRTESSIGSLGEWQGIGLLGGLISGVILAKLLLALRHRGQSMSGGESE